MLNTSQFKFYTDFFQRDFVIIKKIKVRNAEMALLGSGTIVRKALRFGEYLRIPNDDDGDNNNNIRFKNLWFLLPTLSVFIEGVLKSTYKEFTFTTLNLLKPTGHVMRQQV